MEPKRFLLEGPSLPALKARVLAEHGADATIVAAARVTVGGIRGFFARQHYEVTVEVVARRTRAAHARPDLPTRLGIAALMDDADEAEALLHGTASERHTSTESEVFAALMDELTKTTARDGVRAAVGPAAVVPRPLTGQGDLVLLVGLTDETLAVARSMAAAAGAADLRVAGSMIAEGIERVEDRRTALAARASGVERGRSTFVAYGLGPGGADAAGRAAALRSVGADQVWVVVDAGRKPEDTARWVRAVAAAIAIDAAAGLGSEFTRSPRTVEELGLPVAWMDGAAAPSPAPRRAAPAGQGRGNAAR